MAIPGGQISGAAPNIREPIVRFSFLALVQITRLGCHHPACALVPIFIAQMYRQSPPVAEPLVRPKFRRVCNLLATPGN